MLKNVFLKGRLKNIEAVRLRLASVVNTAREFQGRGQQDTHQVGRITLSPFSIFLFQFILDLIRGIKEQLKSPDLVTLWEQLTETVTLSTTECSYCPG